MGKISERYLQLANSIQFAASETSPASLRSLLVKDQGGHRDEAAQACHPKPAQILGLGVADSAHSFHFTFARPACLNACASRLRLV